MEGVSLYELSRQANNYLRIIEFFEITRAIERTLFQNVLFHCMNVKHYALLSSRYIKHNYMTQ